MRHPILALIWECWRLSRRWYLWVLPLAFVIDLSVMRGMARIAVDGPPGFNDLAQIRQMFAPGIFQMNFALALLATLLAVSIGNRSGFPFAFEFRLPVKTRTLVAVPMLTLAALCASLYVVPILFCRLYYDIPFPLLPVAALIAAMVCLLTALSWAAPSPLARVTAMAMGMFGGLQFFYVLDPLGRPLLTEPQQLPRFNPDLIALTPSEYALLAGICTLLYALAVAALRKQRCGEVLMLQLPGKTVAQPGKAGFSLAALLERAQDLYTLPCPVDAPWRAELWLELRRQAVPILLLSGIIAVLAPLMFMLGLMPTRSDVPWVDYLFVYAVLIAGVGIAIFNRRQATAGYMSAFEATRGITTRRLVAIQMFTAAGSTLAGIAIVCASLYFASQLLEEPGSLALRLRALVDPAEASDPLLVAAGVFRGLVNYLSIIALLATVHAVSVVWGRWVPYVAAAIAMYGTVFAVNVQSGSATLEDLENHMWAFAVAIYALTLFAVARVLYLKLLSLRTGLAALLLWGLYLACCLYGLSAQGRSFSALAPELQAFDAALWLAPLMLCALLLWSYERLRRR